MKRILFLLIAGVIFFTRYLFLITVMAEERTTGDFYEPLKIVDIKKDPSGKLIPLYEEFKTKRIGPFELVVNSSEKDSYPKMKIEVGNKQYVVLFANYVGPILQVYIPGIYMKIFGKNIYPIRSILLIIFFFFLFFYIKFVEEFQKDKTLYLAMFLITFPIFSFEFLLTSFISHPVIFSLEILLVMRIKKNIENSFISSSDAFIILLIAGLILHLHLLAGGAVLISIIFSFLITKGNISLRVKLPSITGGIILFLILISPFFLISPSQIFKDIIRGQGPSKIFLFSALIHYIVGVFAFPSFVEVFLGKEFGTKYLPLSIVSGLILSIGFVGMIPERDEKFKKFVFLTSIFYLILTIFADVRSYHINYILPFIALFIPQGLKKFLSEKTIKFVLIIGIFLNIIQIEMLRDSIKNSSLSLSLHKEVARYLAENRIKKIYNFAGRYDYIFIEDEKIEVIDLAPFFFGKGISYKTISDALQVSKGEVILVEKFRISGFTTGISLETVIDVAMKSGLRIRVFKKFPDRQNYELVLVGVE